MGKVSALGDRATIALALECAARTIAPATINHEAEASAHLALVLINADAILAWMDSRAKARAKADPIRTPNYVLPEEFTRA